MRCTHRSAFWIWNLVGNIAFSERYQSAHPMVVQRTLALDATLWTAAAQQETAFVARYATDPAGAIAAMTDFVDHTGQAAFKTWRDFWMFLFATFRDGGVLTQSKATQCNATHIVNCTAKLQPDSDEEGYFEDWKQRIINESPENKARYSVPASATEDEIHLAKMRIVSGKRNGQRAAPVPSPTA